VPARALPNEIVWHTYAPDGRSLMIRKTESGWLATCGPNSGESDRAADAIRAALAGSPPEVGKTAETLDAWIAEHAAELERIAG